MTALVPEQVVHDLMWAITSPSLVRGPEVLTTDPIEVDRIDAAALTAFVGERSSRRVGRYFETLIEYWLRYLREAEILGVGVQVTRQGVTIGELDFIYRAGCVYHLEVAVKFYLYEPRSPGSSFPGPDASDNFETKATKLFGRQLPLSAEHRSDVDVRHALVKGRVFYHVLGGEPPVLPEHMAADHLRGVWLRAGELAALGRGEHGGAIMAKPHWLAPVESAPVMTPALLVERLRGHFDRGGGPQMISVRDSQDPLSEVSRVLVVPNSWPDRLSPADPEHT